MIASAQAGDTTAIDDLCARMYPQVQKIVHDNLSRDIRRHRPWIGAMFSTGDVVQEVFIGVLRDLKDFRGQTEAALLGYVATLTKNRLVDAIRFYEASRRDGRRSSSPEQTPNNPAVDQGLDPAAAALTQEQILRFHRVLSTFGERERNLLRERIENQSQFDAIAEMLGYASADSARKAFHVAQAKMLVRLRGPS